MIFTLLTHFNRKQPQTVLYLFVTLLRKLGFHGVKTIEKLEEADEAAYNFDLEKAFLLNFILEHIVILLGCLNHYVNDLLNVQRNLQILLFNFNEHS